MTGGTDRDRRIVIGGIAATGLAVVVAAVAVDLGGGPTENAGLVYGLHRQLLVVAVTITLLVEGLLVYAVWQFRNNDDRRPTPENRTLELTWTVATAFVLLFVGLTSYMVMAQPAVTPAAGPEAPEDATEVHVTGQQWHWSVAYPAENVSTDDPDRIVLPANRTIRITVASGDVIHSFHAPGLGLKQDAMPGEERTLLTNVSRTGEYRLYCAEYCGNGHSRMKTTIEVVPPEEYRAWLEERRAE